MNLENLRTAPLNEKVLSGDYIRSHVFLGIRKCTNKDDSIRKKLLNLELIMKLQVNISDDEIVSILLTPVLIKRIGISEQKLWEFAAQNTRKNFLVNTVAEMLGISNDRDTGLYIIRTDPDTAADGACALAFPDIIEMACGIFSERGGRIGNCAYLIPSSREEILLLPYRADLKSEDLAYLVQEVNEMVRESIRLDPVVYLFDRHSGEISIAASV